MTVIGFAVSTMFIVFVCTRLICARIQLRASSRAFAGSDLSIMERGIHGLEPVVVSSFPTKYVDQFTYGQDAKCAVCLSDYQEKDLLRVLPYCGHAYHATCIDKWLKHHWTCPVCRISLRESPDRRKKAQPAQSSSIPPLVRENFVPNSYQCQYSGDRYSSDLALHPSRVSVTVHGLPEVNSELASRFESGGKQLENPSNS